MNIKRFLNDYIFLNTELHRLQKELNNLIKNKDDAYCTLRSTPLSGKTGSKDIISDSVSNTVQILVDHYSNEIRHYTSQINKLLDEKRLFEKVWFRPTSITRLERLIIELKFFDGYPWTQVAKAVHYEKTGKHVQRLADKAIEKLQKEVDKLVSDETKGLSSA